MKWHFRAKRFASSVRTKDFIGVWYAVWETTVDGQLNVNREVVEAKARGAKLQVRNMTPSLENQLGGYLWHGTLQLWTGVIAIGRYEAVDPSKQYAGSLFYVVHPSGQFMYGRWVGLNFDAPLATGRTVLARTPATADEQFALAKTAESSGVEHSLRSLYAQEE